MTKIVFQNRWPYKGGSAVCDCIRLYEVFVSLLLSDDLHAQRPMSTNSAGNVGCSGLAVGRGPLIHCKRFILLHRMPRVTINVT